MTWAAVTTSTGKPPQTVDELAKRRSVILTATNEALRAGARVVVFPEQYAGSWSLGERYFIQGAIGPSLRNARATLLIGGDAKHQISGVKTNALLIYDGHTWDAVHANFAVPVSMWAPWRNDSYAVGWFEKNAIQIEGRNLVVSLCYEDFLVWPHLIALLGEQPDAFVSIANAWWAAGTDAIAVQRDHARLWAKVLGVPMIRALNAPS